MRAVVLFGHGSRDPAWRRPMDAVAGRIRALAPGTPVVCAFLEAQPPDLGSAVDQLVALGAAGVTVFPLFLGVGRHAREDLPRLVQQARERHPGVAIALAPAAGERPELVDLLARLALEQP
jgi:sirohydrochlorin cobaltochelatase